MWEKTDPRAGLKLTNGVKPALGEHYRVFMRRGSAGMIESQLREKEERDTKEIQEFRFQKYIEEVPRQRSQLSSYHDSITVGGSYRPLEPDRDSTLQTSASKQQEFLPPNNHFKLNLQTIKFQGYNGIPNIDSFCLPRDLNSQLVKRREQGIRTAKDVPVQTLPSLRLGNESTQSDYQANHTGRQV